MNKHDRLKEAVREFRDKADKAGLRVGTNHGEDRERREAYNDAATTVEKVLDDHTKD